MKKLIQGLGLLTLTLSLVACGSQGGMDTPDSSETASVQKDASTTSQSQEQVEDKATDKQEKANAYLDWQGDYRALSNISRLNDFGHMSFTGDHKVYMDRNETELRRGQEEGYLSGDYTIKAYEGEQKISTILYPFPEEMHTAAGYPTTEVLPEVQIDVTIPQSEIDRIGTENKESKLTLYGYHGDKDYLILTDGKGAESKLYVYMPESDGGLTSGSSSSSSRTTSQSATKAEAGSNKSSKVSVDRLKSGDMGALEGTWVSNYNTWNINSYGGLGTGEILDLSNEWTSEVGVNLLLKYRSVATPILFIPAGVAHGESDASRDRLVFINSPDEKPAESNYFYKQ